MPSKMRYTRHLTSWVKLTLLATGCIYSSIITFNEKNTSRFFSLRSTLLIQLESEWSSSWLPIPGENRSNKLALSFGHWKTFLTKFVCCTFGRSKNASSILVFMSAFSLVSTTRYSKLPKMLLYYISFFRAVKFSSYFFNGIQAY